MALERRSVVILRADGSVAKYRITPKVEMQFERVYKRSLGSISGDATAMYQLAWECEKAGNGGEVVKAFDTWAEEVDAIDVVVDPVPFSSTPSTGD